MINKDLKSEQFVCHPAVKGAGALRHGSDTVRKQRKAIHLLHHELKLQQEDESFSSSVLLSDQL